MSEGYLTTTSGSMAVPPHKASLVVSRPGYNPYRLGSVLFPTRVLSYRSGPSFDRLFDSGSLYKGETISEHFSNSLSGDTGHEYEKIKMKNWSLLKWSNSTFAGLPCGPELGYYQGYTGHIGSFDPLVGPTWTNDMEVAQAGTAFLDATFPAQSTAKLSQDIYETIRDGLPKVIGTIVLGAVTPGKYSLLRKLGEEWLNLVFGINPLLSDLAKTVNSVIQIDKLIAQWQRDSGRDVTRRRATPWLSELTYANQYSAFTTDTDNQYAVWYKPGTTGSSSPVKTTSNWRGRGQVIMDETVTTRKKLSFSALYNYDLYELLVGPLPVRTADKEEVLRETIREHVFGLSLKDMLSLPNVWQVASWSWLIDWFVNLGQMLDVANTLDDSGLVVKFGYVTLVERVIWDYNVSVSSTAFATPWIRNQLVDYYRVRRLKATPFGFGTTFSSLTSFQSGVLASLAAKSGERRIPHHLPGG